MLSIKELRKEKKVTQSLLAEAIGVTLRTIQHYEAGSTDIPTHNLIKIAKYFNVNPNAIRNEVLNDYSFEKNQVNESMVKYGPEIKESLHNFLEKIITDTIRKETEYKFQMLNEKLIKLERFKMDKYLEDKISKSEKKKTN